MDDWIKLPRRHVHGDATHYRIAPDSGLCPMCSNAVSVPTSNIYYKRQVTHHWTLRHFWRWPTRVITYERTSEERLWSHDPVCTVLHDGANPIQLLRDCEAVLEKALRAAAMLSSIVPNVVDFRGDANAVSQMLDSLPTQWHNDRAHGQRRMVVGPQEQLVDLHSALQLLASRDLRVLTVGTIEAVLDRHTDQPIRAFSVRLTERRTGPDGILRPVNAYPLLAADDYVSFAHRVVCLRRVIELAARQLASRPA